jgi:hypothetical protein
MPDSGNTPEWAKETLTAYVETGRPTGDFIAACLSNDLVDAIGRADENSLAHIADIVSWIYNIAPSACWGSRETVRDWMKQSGMKGMTNE